MIMRCGYWVAVTARGLVSFHLSYKTAAKKAGKKGELFQASSPKEEKKFWLPYKRTCIARAI